MATEYLNDHPYLNFEPDLRGAPFTLWMLLGEAKSKCDHIANAPLFPHLAEHLHRVSLVKGALATTAIEGNTLTEDEAFDVLDDKSELPPSRKYLGTEIKNVMDACNALMVLDHSLPIEIGHINQFNKWLLQGLALEDNVIPGSLRDVNVRVGGVYRAPDWRHVENLMEKFVKWLNEFGTIQQGLNKQHAAILKAILSHLYLVWVHPYGDGNGRTARLLEWKILLEAGLPTPAAHLLSNHYNLTRSQYYIELRKAGATGSVVAFVEYALQGLVDGLREQTRIIHGQQLGIMWQDMIHTLIPGVGKVELRRRGLADAIATAGRPVPRSNILNLSVDLYKEYNSLGPRTLARDLNWLTGNKILLETPTGFYPRFSRVLSLLPKRLNCGDEDVVMIMNIAGK